MWLWRGSRVAEDTVVERVYFGLTAFEHLQEGTFRIEQQARYVVALVVAVRGRENVIQLLIGQRMARGARVDGVKDHTVRNSAARCMHTGRR
ncbi:MAG: hypothetical protein AAF730_05415 [Bacteroidota bacterium]